MIHLLLLVALVFGGLLWISETAPMTPHGLDSFDVPPPIPTTNTQEAA